ncbi:hypothetical protein ACSMFR_05835 [Listeria aquatica]|uniref:hypothetical protein n=1 Tax=Listeria aquatica TaxID=1494960 RepID=UPI003F70776E
MKKTTIGIGQIILFLILSFIIPVIGILFSILLIKDLKGTEEFGWAKALAIVTLILQLLSIVFMLVGLLTFYLATPVKRN